MNIQFSERDRNQVMEYLTEALRGTDLVPKEFTDNIFETAQDTDFAIVLCEWLNHKTDDAVTDIEVNGWHLHQMMYCYDDPHLGILMSLIPLYLEKTQPEEYAGIAAFAGEMLYADFEAVEAGDFLSDGVRGADGYWYLFGEHRGALDLTDEEAKNAVFAAYDVWPILMDYPELIEPLSKDLLPGSSIVQIPGSIEYMIFPPDDADAEEANDA